MVARKFLVVHAGLWSLFVLFGFASCTKQSGFEGASKRLSKSVVAQQDAVPLLPTFSAEIADALSSVSKRDIWFVSYEGRVERFSLKNIGAKQDDEIWGSTGTWQLAGGASGHRTYVTEVGLIVGKTGSAAMYRIGDDTPVGSTVAPIWAASSPASIAWSPHVGQPARFCLTSFRSGGKSYIGGGYTKAPLQIAFVRIPIDKSKPNMVDVAAASETILGNGVWGYSCFTDQSRNIFWSQLWGPGPINGIQLDTNKALTSEANAPNGKFKAAAMTSFNQTALTQASYALSGDAFGNLLNSGGMYTYAYEPVSKMVFGSSYNRDKLTITRVECFASKTDCKDGVDHWVFDQTSMGLSIGPMSSLNDGRVVGISAGSVWLLRLKDPKDPSKGPVAKKIADAVGWGYMYTDFTGATLYAADVEKSADLTLQQGFKVGSKVQALKLKWNAESGQIEEWRGLKLGIRCYNKSVTQKPEYAPVATVPQAGVEFGVEVAGCNDTVFDTVDVHMSPDDSVGGFTKTRSFVFSGAQ